MALLLLYHANYCHAHYCPCHLESKEMIGHAAICDSVMFCFTFISECSLYYNDTSLALHYTESCHKQWASIYIIMHTPVLYYSFVQVEICLYISYTYSKKIVHVENFSSLFVEVQMCSALLE